MEEIFISRFLLLLCQISITTHKGERFHIKLVEKKAHFIAKVFLAIFP